MSRLEDLQRVEKALWRIARIGTGREAARLRAERSGLPLSRPSISIISALSSSGPVRLSGLAQLCDLEASLISREVGALVADGYVDRSADPTDGRAFIVELTAKGREAYTTYRAATDDIVIETLVDWSADEIAALADNLERLVADIRRAPRATPARAR
jgi:DNA-binding MarR family transcriptional regulator